MGYITPGHMTISFWPSSPCYTCIWFCVGMLIWSLISCWALWICRLGLSQAFRLDTGRISLCHICIYELVARYATNHAEKYYYGLSEPEFKSRYANHKSSLKYPSKRNTTELSKYYWELRDKGVDKKDIKVDWRIERQAHKYKCGTRRCDLCLTEKLVIALADKSTMLNKRSEIISACPHRTKYRYNKVTKVKMK